VRPPATQPSLACPGLPSSGRALWREVFDAAELGGVRIPIRPVAVGWGLGVTLVAATLIRVRLLVVAVSGTSMLPTVASGDRLLVVRKRPGHRGHVLALRVPLSVRGPDWAVGPELVIKRLTGLPGDELPGQHLARAVQLRLQAGTIWVEGDNTRSLDSRSWGPLAIDTVIGVALVNLGQPEAPRLSRLHRRSVGRFPHSRTPDA